MKIILTGATGFVGEGVLLACLEHPDVKEVLMLNRRHFDLSHPKLNELIVKDFFHLDVELLKGYDACFYCAGKTSAGMNEKDYSYLTFDTTLALADTVLASNSGITFCFVSGSHTDSTGKGKIMWARVKGRTENALMKMSFAREYNFRPGGMIATAGQNNAGALYKFIVKTLALIKPSLVSTMEEVGLAMINAALRGYPKQILEVKDIKEAAKVHV